MIIKCMHIFNCRFYLYYMPKNSKVNKLRGVKKQLLSADQEAVTFVKCTIEEPHLPSASEKKLTSS